LKRYGIKLRENSHYTDYDDWLRQEPGRSIFSALLFDREALYPEYVDRQEVVRLWKEQLAGVDWADELCRYVTFELWLRQVFRNEFRPCASE
jgi:asparagine synthase (glutamine-hydrolysing)